MEEAKKNLIEAYQNLDIESKRNEFNSEIIKLSLIVNSFLKLYDNDEFTSPNNYTKGIAQDENEFLTQTYISIVEMKYNLILLLKYLEKDK